MLPSGVQAQIAIRPPGLRTRAISPAVLAWSGANMQPNTETTASKLASSNGSCSASPSIQSISTPASAALARPASRSSGVMSRPVTVAPVFAAGIVALPLPQATSSTVSLSSTWAAFTAATPAPSIRCTIDG
jgi:hypothetical protein